MKNTQKGFVIPALVAIAVLVIAGGAYWGVKNRTTGPSEMVKNEVNDSTQDSVSPTTTSITTGTGDSSMVKGLGYAGISGGRHSEPTSEWKTYTSSDWGYEVKHPSFWKINIQTTDLGTIATIYDPDLAGKEDTDIPSEGVKIFATQTCTESSWAQGFGSMYYRVGCYSSGRYKIQINFSAFNARGMAVEDAINASFKLKADSSLPTKL